MIPPIVNPTIADPDTRSVAAVAGAAAQLSALRSFQFSVDIVGLDVARLEPSSVDFALRGTVTHTNGFAMDALVGTRMRETNGIDASITTSDRVIVGAGYAWGVDSRSGASEPSSVPWMVGWISTLAPEGLAERLVVPFAAGYTRVGNEMHGGVMTAHLRASTGGAAAYAAAMKYDGKLTADLWISSATGHLVAVRIAGKGSHPDPSTGASIDDGFNVAFEVTHPDAPANVVDLPVLPVPDPVRPSGPPVDLQLEYEVLSLDGVTPNAGELDDIAVSMRVRLDVSVRPMKVDFVKPNRLVVTVCNTTRAADDRRTLEANGALTVVPLPASEYGSTATPGIKALPVVGGSIDPALRPIAPAAGVGLAGTHVDPVTGRRGVSFRLNNKDGDAFEEYAKVHPGEYVAVVLDGVVLATLPIAEQVANGHFAFTGDYTEAETHVLVMSLYKGPLRFPLQKVRDVEVPAP